MNTAMKYALPEGGAAGTKAIWVGRILSALAIAFFVMDGVMKLIQPQVVIDATRQIGWPVDPMTLTSLGLILLACTALYAFPRTAVLGAILLTGYLGGAVASHARHGDPLLTHDLFGVYLGRGADRCFQQGERMASRTRGSKSGNGTLKVPD
jgi:DoxX-like family